MTFTFFFFTRDYFTESKFDLGRLSQSDSLDPHFLAYGITKDANA